MEYYRLGLSPRAYSNIRKLADAQGITLSRVLRGSLAMYDYVQKNCSPEQKILFEKDSSGKLFVTLIPEEKSGLVKKLKTSRKKK